MQKQAYGWLPSISAGLYAAASSRSRHVDVERQRNKARQLNEAFAELIAERNRPMREALTQTRMPTVLHANRMQGLISGQDVPLGYYDQGMIRMASAIGEELADLHKEAGIAQGFSGLFGGLLRGGKQVAQGAHFGAAALKQRAGKAITRGVGNAVQGVQKGVNTAVQGAQQGVSNVRNAVSNAQNTAKSIGPSLKQRATAVSDNIGNKMTAWGQRAEQAGQNAGTAIGRSGAGIKTPPKHVATQPARMTLTPSKPVAASPTAGAGVGASPGSTNQVGTGAPKPIAAAPPAKQVQQAAPPPAAKAQSATQPAPAQQPGARPAPQAAPAQTPQLPAQGAAPAQQAATVVPTPPAQKPVAAANPQSVSPNAAATNPAPVPPAAQPAETTAPGKPGFLERTQKDLGDGKWKKKLPLLALAGGASYGLYRGAKGVANYMQSEHGPEQYNRGGIVPPQGVNQYGVPDRVN